MNAIDLKRNFDFVEKKKNETARLFGRDPKDIRVLAVSKTHPADTIEKAVEIGINAFGENYVQELVEKNQVLSAKGINPEWHFIGHLQTNKVKYLAPFVSMIHSVDSTKLAAEISKQAEKHGRNIDVLLQVNTSGEQSKSGCEPVEIVEIAKTVITLPNICLKGVMTIGTFSDNEEVIRREFGILKDCLARVNSELNIDLKELSMGMSHDFEIAVEEGSTMLRVGTAIFGERDYRF